MVTYINTAHITCIREKDDEFPPELARYEPEYMEGPYTEISLANSKPVYIFSKRANELMAEIKLSDFIRIQG